MSSKAVLKAAGRLAREFPRRMGRKEDDAAGNSGVQGMNTRGEPQQRDRGRPKGAKITTSSHVIRELIHGTVRSLVPSWTNSFIAQCQLSESTVESLRLPGNDNVQIDDEDEDMDHVQDGTESPAEQKETVSMARRRRRRRRRASKMPRISWTGQNNITTNLLLRLRLLLKPATMVSPI